MTFDPEKVDVMLDHITKLKDLRRRQGELLDELAASVIAECGKRLDHPKARAAFIAAKEAELKATGVVLDSRGYAKSRVNWRRGTGDDGKAEWLWRQIAKAKCFEDHGGCDIDKDTDVCRRCRNPRDTEKKT